MTDQPDSETRAPKPPARGTAWAWGTFALLVLLGTTADLVSKWWIFRRLGLPGESPPWVLVPGMLSLETTYNEGALFGLGDGFAWLFAALSLVALAGIVLWLAWGGAVRDRWLVVALGLIVAGILGNLYDRLGLHGLTWHHVVLNADGTVRHHPGDPVRAVRDWIHVYYEDKFDWPVFNIADSLLVCGVLMLLVHAWVLEPKTKKTPSGEEATEPQAAVSE